MKGGPGALRLHIALRAEHWGLFFLSCVADKKKILWGATFALGGMEGSRRVEAVAASERDLCFDRSSPTGRRFSE